MNRTVIELRRHAEPMKDPETKRSMDCLTVQGMTDAMDLGSRDYLGQNDLRVYHSGMSRARETADGILVGAGVVPVSFEDMPRELGLGAFKGKKLPSGVPYGAEFIDYIVAENPGIAQVVGQEVMGFLERAYQGSMDGGSALGISHGPKVEMGYGLLVGVPENELGQFAASPLDGFALYVDRNERSGSIDQVTLGFKGEKNQPLAKEMLPFLR